MHSNSYLQSLEKRFKHTDKAFLEDWERKFILVWLPHIPSFIQTYHLTLLTLFFSGCVVFFGILAQKDIRWLWLVSLCIVCQWVTDVLDGALGRHRKTGLVRWGYYMDHLLDYIFLAALSFSYYGLAPGEYRILMFILFAVVSSFMVHSFLTLPTTGIFKITFFRFGPPEIRILAIIFNTILISAGWQTVIPFVVIFLVCACVSFIVLVFKTYQHLWMIDMEEKKN